MPGVLYKRGSMTLRSKKKIKIVFVPQKEKIHCSNNENDKFLEAKAEKITK